MADAAERDVLRLGYLGAVAAAEEVVRAAGAPPASVKPVEVAVADPFGPLRSGDVDVLLSRFAVDEPDLSTSQPLYSEDRVLVAARSHPLAGQSSVSYEDVADYELFARPPAMSAGIYEQIVPGRTPSGRPVRRVRAASSVAEMAEVVLSGQAVHPTISSLASWLTHPGLVFLPIDDLPPAPVALTWLTSAATPRVRDFVHAAVTGWPRP